MDEALYRYVDGVWMHNFFRDETVRSAIKYKPRDGDVIIVTYPKCGTNWTQFIIWNILTRAKPSPDVGEFSLMSPFLEMTGAGAAENPSRIGPLVTHLPMSVFQPVEHAKYVYVARNPYDCAASYYHFIMGITPKTVTDVSFERFISMYLNGKVTSGDYFDHLLPRYEQRHDTNVMLMTYEELKMNTRAQVLKIAEFLEEEHATALLQDEGLVRTVIEVCSLEGMNAFFSETPEGRMKKLIEAALVNSKSFELLNSMPADHNEMHEGSVLVRRGFVGVWKNYLCREQIERTTTWIEQKTGANDVMTLWKDCDLPGGLYSETFQNLDQSRKN
ncbi:amine sulfotransferase-like isoform X1 [Amblyomma americanum]